MNLLGKLLNPFAGMPRPGKAAAARITRLKPCNGPVYAVGDVHGCLDLYLCVERAILQDAMSYSGTATVVLLGDMIDRGPQSAGLIDHLLRPPPGSLQRLCLMGNHEAMMLDFLASPRDRMDWLQVGGHETLVSYGVTLDLATLSATHDRPLRQIVAAHVPESHLELLRQTLGGLVFGEFLLAHAGADACASLSAQPLQAVLWGSAGVTAPSGLILVHGHHITAAPAFDGQRIAIDTGAYATGHLTALRLISGEPPAVFTTGAAPQFRALPTAP